MSERGSRSSTQSERAPPRPADDVELTVRRKTAADVGAPGFLAG
ncbi:MAG: hypothetical protein ACRDRK_10470 [Pseudonocardia sp.]